VGGPLYRSRDAIIIRIFPTIIGLLGHATLPRRSTTSLLTTSNSCMASTALPAHAPAGQREIASYRLPTKQTAIRHPDEQRFVDFWSRPANPGNVDRLHATCRTNSRHIDAEKDKLDAINYRCTNNTVIQLMIISCPVGCTDCCIHCSSVYVSVMYDLTYALSLPVEHRPQTTRPSPSSVLCCRLHFLSSEIEARCLHSISRSRFQVFLGRLFPLWFCSVHCSACLAMLSSLRLSVCPMQFRFLFLRLAVYSFSFTVPFWLFCPASVYSESFSGIY